MSGQLWYCAYCSHGHKLSNGYGNKLGTYQLENGKDETIRESSRCTCESVTRFSGQVGSSVSPAPLSRSAAAKVKSQCSSKYWKTGWRDSALYIACVSGLIIGPLAFDVSRSVNVVAIANC